MRELVEAFCDKHSVLRSKGRKFNEDLYESIFADEKRRKEMYNEVFKGAQALWTSALVFKVNCRCSPDTLPLLSVADASVCFAQGGRQAGGGAVLDHK